MAYKQNQQKTPHRTLILHGALNSILESILIFVFKQITTVGYSVFLLFPLPHQQILKSIAFDCK